MATRTEIIPIWTERDLALVDAHPKVARLFAHWKSRHRPEGMPGRAQLDPLELGDLLPGLWLVEVRRQPFRLRYRLVGARVVEAMGRDVTGLWFDEAHTTAASQPNYMERSKTVVETGVPSWRRGPPRLWRHDVYSQIENLILPLADDGRTIDLLIVLTVFYRLDGTAE